MKIEARNLLAEAILEAFDDPEAALALRCLATYCNVSAEPLTFVPLETLCATLADDRSARMRSGLQRSPLLLWEFQHEEKFASLVPLLTEDYRLTVAKLRQYANALAVWTPDESRDGRTTALAKAVCLFNHHLFFEVHEILEEQWKQEEGEVRLFLQGLIQIAVAFHHLGNGNFRGATALLHDGLTKITPHQPQFLDIELQDFVSHIVACHKELRRLGPEHFQQLPSEMIPSLQFVA